MLLLSPILIKIQTKQKCKTFLEMIFMTDMKLRKLVLAALFAALCTVMTMVIQVSPEASEDEIQAAFRPNTKALFGETIANPSIEVLDIEKFARIAHRNGVPLIVDNTFATPVLCRPIEFGADIVVHSTTKYMDGHALQMGGVIVDGGTFDWTNGKFPEFIIVLILVLNLK